MNFSIFTLLEEKTKTREFHSGSFGSPEQVPDSGLVTAQPSVVCHAGSYIIENEIEFSITPSTTKEQRYFNA